MIVAKRAARKGRGGGGQRAAAAKKGRGGGRPRGTGSPGGSGGQSRGGGGSGSSDSRRSAGGSGGFEPGQRVRLIKDRPGRNGKPLRAGTLGRIISVSEQMALVKFNGHAEPRRVMQEALEAA